MSETEEISPDLQARLDNRRKPKSVAERSVSKWSRWLHVYTSMISLLIVLFFGITGITLNHPTWTFGDEPTTVTEKGTFPFTIDADNVDFLKISEYARTKYGVSGDISDYEVTNGQGIISYRGPGYSSDLTFTVSNASFHLTTVQQGWVAVMNDLHKGRDTSSSWKWVIDVSAGLLVIVAITGLVMQFFLAKRRRSALTWALIGTIATVVLIYLTMV